MPNDNATVDVHIVKQDNNGPYPPEILVLSVPRSAVDGRVSITDAATDLIDRISRDYVNSVDANVPEDEFTFGDFLRIPAEFIAGYGVSVRPFDAVIVEIAVDDPVIDG